MFLQMWFLFFVHFHISVELYSSMFLSKHNSSTQTSNAQISKETLTIFVNRFCKRQSLQSTNLTAKRNQQFLVIILSSLALHTVTQYEMCSFLPNTTINCVLVTKAKAHPSVLICPKNLNFLVNETSIDGKLIIGTSVYY